MKYDYGDEVIYRAKQSDGGMINRPGAIVGITEVLSDKQAEVLGFPLGTVLYTVEFGDGSDQNIPEAELVPLDPE